MQLAWLARTHASNEQFIWNSFNSFHSSIFLYLWLWHIIIIIIIINIIIIIMKTIVIEIAYTSMLLCAYKHNIYDNINNNLQVVKMSMLEFLCDFTTFSVFGMISQEFQSWIFQCLGEGPKIHNALVSHWCWSHFRLFICSFVYHFRAIKSVVTRIHTCKEQIYNKETSIVVSNRFSLVVWRMAIREE